MSVNPELGLLLTQLDQALSHEPPVCPQSPLDSSAITSGMRDGSAHVLRCLKVWYDLPSEVFLTAVCSMDRFLAKMKAQPKHLSCIAVAAFHWACQHHHTSRVPDPADLVTISQSRCSPSDLKRMQTILANKLGGVGQTSALSLLRLMYFSARTALRCLGIEDDGLDDSSALPAHLVHQLEILACDSVTWLTHRPAEIVLALLTTHFRAHPGFTAAHSGVLDELAKRCGASLSGCLGVVVARLDKYNGEGTVTHRQRLVWRLSNRTMRHLRPTYRLRLTLPTIKEANAQIRHRSNSECSEESLSSLSDDAMSIEGEDIFQTA